MREFPLAEGDASKVVLRKGDEKVYAGVIAQEVEAVLPECIKVSAEGAKTVSTDPILWSMLNAIKELSAKNEALEARLAALESK